MTIDFGKGDVKDSTQWIKEENLFRSKEELIKSL